MHNGPAGQLWPCCLCSWPAGKLWTSDFSRGFLVLFPVSYFICLVQLDHSAKSTFFYILKEKSLRRSPWFWFDYPCTILRTIISLVFGGERWIVRVEDSSFKNPFFFPQNVTVEGECVTARLENASQTVLKFLLAQTAQPSVRRLSWEHQKLISLLSLDAYKC